MYIYLKHLPINALASLVHYAASTAARTFAPGIPIGPAWKGSKLGLGLSGGRSRSR